MSDTPRTDALVKADWRMPKGWKDRIHEHARQLERELSAARHNLAVILQTACDADEAPAKELLSKIAAIASKHPWPTNAAPQALTDKEGQSVPSPAVAAPDFELKLRNECGHPWPGNYPTPASWYCKCGMKVYRSYEDACDD